MTANVIRLPTATVIRQAYEKHLAELMVSERNVRRHAPAIAFRRCMNAIIEETGTSESCAAGYLARLGLVDVRPPPEESLAKMRIATRHLSGRYGNPR